MVGQTLSEVSHICIAVLHILIIFSRIMNTFKLVCGSWSGNDNLFPDNLKNSTGIVLCFGAAENFLKVSETIACQG